MTPENPKIIGIIAKLRVAVTGAMGYMMALQNGEFRGREEKITEELTTAAERFKDDLSRLADADASKEFLALVGSAETNRERLHERLKRRGGRDAGLSWQTEIQLTQTLLRDVISIQSLENQFRGDGKGPGVHCPRCGSSNVTAIKHYADLAGVGAGGRPSKQGTVGGLKRFTCQDCEARWSHR